VFSPAQVITKTNVKELGLFEHKYSRQASRKRNQTVQTSTANINVKPEKSIQVMSMNPSVGSSQVARYNQVSYSFHGHSASLINLKMNSRHHLSQHTYEDVAPNQSLFESASQMQSFNGQAATALEEKRKLAKKVAQKRKNALSVASGAPSYM
jgi:hypothetical protein